MQARTAIDRTAPAPAAPAEDARERLLHAALRLFAQQGYSKTSTRELAEAASVNVASISYYFGDKAGLYRAVFNEPLGGTAADEVARYDDPAFGLAQALGGFFDGFLEPLRQGDVARLCMKLHLREMLEPTGLWDDALAHGFRPMHEALIVVLCRHLGLAAPDADLHRLAVALAGLGVHLHTGRDLTDLVAPGLNEGAQAIELWRARLVMFGHAMVQAEAARRELERSGTEAK